MPRRQNEAPTPENSNDALTLLTLQQQVLQLTTARATLDDVLKLVHESTLYNFTSAQDRRTLNTAQSCLDSLRINLRHSRGKSQTETSVAYFTSKTGNSGSTRAACRAVRKEAVPIIPNEHQLVPYGYGWDWQRNHPTITLARANFLIITDVLASFFVDCSRLLSESERGRVVSPQCHLGRRFTNRFVWEPHTRVPTDVCLSDSWHNCPSLRRCLMPGGLLSAISGILAGGILGFGAAE